MNKVKILIIDDDLDVLSTTKLFLEANNFEVDTAINSKLGMDVLKKFHPDILILDIMMDSNLEGFNFLNELKSNEEFSKIPVIMNTSLANKLGVNLRSAVEDVYNLPVTVYVEKSGDWDELLNAVNGLISISL